MAGILNVAAMLLSIRAVMAPLLGERTEEFSFQIPVFSVPLILLVTVLLALFIAAGMMILASFARTFKEGQSLVSPFYVAMFLPALFLQMPGIEFNAILALIPVVNVVMVFREAVAGMFQWHLIGLTLCIEIICVSLALWLATSILRYEDFLIGSFDGSFGKFLQKRLLVRSRPGEQIHE
jgi:ABC-type Na+ efflux pump permease subunit